MDSSISTLIFNAGQTLAQSTENFAEKFNEIISQFLVWPFRAGQGLAIDDNGQASDRFGSIIYAASPSQSDSDSIRVNANNVAAVVDISEKLDESNLAAAYERIAYAKRLKKSKPPSVEGTAHTNITLGIILAHGSDLPMETLADKVDGLNAQHSDREWPDMLVVLSNGVINYSAQFPGDNTIGDFLPPAEGALQKNIPAIYVIMFIKPTGAYTFNKMCSYLMAHLAIFSPGSRLPNWNLILQDVPNRGITVTGYQYNLSGKLMPVPQQFYNDRFIPPRPFLIEDQRGTLLAVLQFLPWQDGGVIVLRGKLPLVGLLVFLEKKVDDLGIEKLGDSQISHVLPIKHADFLKMLERIQRQSNMIVKLDPSKIVIQKFADEGTKSPFMARIFLGILQLRDSVFSNEKRELFDKTYDSVLNNILHTRDSSNEIAQLISDHLSKVASGEIGQLRGSTIQIDKSIDKELRKEVEAFLNSAVRTLKQSMQDLAKTMGVDMGFLFKKQSTFEEGQRKLEAMNRPLAIYLRETRLWSEQLINSRNAMEHEGWTLPRVKYSVDSGVITADEPEISGQKVTEFVKFIFDRLSCFVEEVTVHCLQTLMPAGTSITEIPISLRDPDNLLRFRITLLNGGQPIWTIIYHRTSFEET
jgi:hypothetical protein